MPPCRVLLALALVASTLVVGAPAHAQGAPESSGSLGLESTPLALLREAEQDAALRDPPVTLADAASRNGGALPAGMDSAFLARLIEPPSLPVRTTARVLRSLALFRDDARARRAVASWLRHAGRYRARIEPMLAAEGVPTDLVWVVAAESDFDPMSLSPVGAAGLWQLMPDAARTYGLRVDAWVDERRDPERSTRAAARYLRDLRARFGSWELALAAYNMGYNALLRSIRRYNTNDLERIAALEAGLPFETAQYVPRILTAALVARNASAFGLDDATPDAAVRFDDARVLRSLPLDALAHALDVPADALARLNPALLRARTPPGPFTLHVPEGQGARAEALSSQLALPATRVARLRFGESVDELAARYGLTPTQLRALSALPSDARVVAGTEILVPDQEPVALASRERPMVAIDAPAQPPEGARRVFYRVGSGDALVDVARALGVRRDELLRWNALDEGARLQSGMWLQVFVAHDPTEARVWSEDEVELVRRGSDEFHDRIVADQGRVRMRVVVREGDTMDSLAAHYGLTLGTLARINRRARHAALTPGEGIVVYVDPERLDALLAGASSESAPAACAPAPAPP